MLERPGCRISRRRRPTPAGLLKAKTALRATAPVFAFRQI